MNSYPLQRHRPVGLFLAIFALSTAVWAQAPATSAQVPAPTIRVTTHMVLVDVVVTDKQGKALTTLGPEDFVVEENGKPQKIATFVKAGHSPSAAEPLPPGIYSNRPEYRTTGGPITVLLLDALNTEFKDQAYARQQMLRFVQQQYQPGKRMAIFTLTGSLGVLQDFTTDPQILYTALQRYQPQPKTLQTAVQPTQSGEGAATTSQVATDLDAATSPLSDSSASAAVAAFAGAQVGYAEDQRAVITLNALSSLSRILGGLPGRKSVIWVTGELPFSLIPEDRNVTEAELGEDLPSLNTRRVGEHAAGSSAAFFRQSHAEDIRETSARLSSAQVAIYPVDARGLSISTDIDSQETMREMARETGGRAYVNQNEIKDGVSRAFEDELATYTIGYYPENKKYDGKYRSLKVKVNQGGVETFSRRGYYAIDPAQIKGYNASQDVSSAMSNAAPATQVSFTAQVVPPEANPTKGKVGVYFLVDASTITQEDASGGKKLNVLFYTSVYSADGKLTAHQSQKVDQVFDNDSYQKIMQHGMMLHMDLDAKGGASQVRLAVQDGRTGLVGTINAPVKAAVNQ